jgi:endonuclease III-like uncharacterized protein
MGKMQVKKIENTIFPVAFYRVKARQIKAISQKICNDFHGKAPDTIDALLLLPGVGRKTANIVVPLAYKMPGICVDTHVHRICNRWGFVFTTTPHETEQALRGKLLESGGFLSMECWSPLVKIYAHRFPPGAVFVLWVNIVKKIVFYLNGNEILKFLERTEAFGRN